MNNLKNHPEYLDKLKANLKEVLTKEGKEENKEDDSKPDDKSTFDVSLVFTTKA